MADLVITEDDGWEELEDLMEAIQSGGVRAGDLEDAIRSGDFDEAMSLLDSAGYEFEKDSTVDFRMFLVPDDIIGYVYRVWVRES
jgi:hypothetical protein